MYLKIGIVNFLTIIRVIGTLFLIPIYNLYGGKTVGFLSLICYFTDSIDGILARKWKASTFFGALFDGVADKLFNIINFVLLYLITPYALVPIIIEVLIVIVQMIKFNRNLNIQSNIIGKAKVWFLALSVVLTFLASDISNINVLSINFRAWVLSLPDEKLYLYLLLPAIIMELLTLFSYMLEICFPKNIELITTKPKKIENLKLSFKERKEYIKNIWLSPDFYEKHKDDTNLRDLRKLSKENR